MPELDFEIPAGTQSGTITTVEGILTEAAAAMRSQQELRKVEDPEGAAALEAFLERLDAAAGGETGFTLVLDDPAGNAGVESTGPGDRELSVAHYERTREQAAAVGLLPGGEEEGGGQGAAGPAPYPGKPCARLDPSEIRADDPHHGHAPVGAAAAHRALARLEGDRAEQVMSRYAAPEEVMEMPGHCGACGGPTATRMYRTTIPFFKEVILMSDACDGCGYRNSEVKGGGGVPAQWAQDRAARRGARGPAEGRDQGRDGDARDPGARARGDDGHAGGAHHDGRGPRRVGRRRAQAHAVVRARRRRAGVDGRRVEKVLRGAEAVREPQEGGEPWTLRLTDPLANSFISGLDVTMLRTTAKEEDGGGGRRGKRERRRKGTSGCRSLTTSARPRRTRTSGSTF